MPDELARSIRTQTQIVAANLRACSGCKLQHPSAIWNRLEKAANKVTYKTGETTRRRIELANCALKVVAVRANERRVETVAARREPTYVLYGFSWRPT
jgi:NMD protein affecting ribosome stability and mRNA decay